MQHVLLKAYGGDDRNYNSGDSCMGNIRVGLMPKK